MDIVCDYCGVAHASAQSFCNGCGSALPATSPAAAAPEPDTHKTRNWVFAGVASALLAVAVLVMANRLSPPQQVEIVNLPDTQQPMLALDAATPAGAQQRRYLMAARFAAAYTSVQSLRMLLVEYRMSEGSYPQQFTDVGMDPAELTDGEYVSGVSLQAGGVLVARLEPDHFGADAMFTLTPRDVMGGTRTRWDCQTTLPDEDRVSGPGHIPCEFDAALIAKLESRD